MAYRVGIDIGSTATKVAVFSGNTLVYTWVDPTGYSSVEAAVRVVANLEEQGFAKDVCAFVATGYGRVAVPFADKTVTEITCHGKGAAYLFGGDCTVVDIGGQDTKAIVLKNGRVVNFHMNDKCSAGTGKFLEVMANRLGLTQDQLSTLARRGKPTTISSMCTVFAESEVISLIGQGTPREDICFGIVESVVAKVKPLVPTADDGRYVLTGGLCENDYVVDRLAKQLNGTVVTNPMARYAGAIGAALCLPEDVVPNHGDVPEVTPPAAASKPEIRPTTFVVTFQTTSDSLAFEKAMRVSGAPGHLAPIPNQLTAGCGYTWQAPLSQKDVVLEAARINGCAYVETNELAL